MRRRSFLKLLSGAALGACLGIQSLLPDLAPRREECLDFGGALTEQELDGAFRQLAPYRFPVIWVSRRELERLARGTS